MTLCGINSENLVKDVAFSLFDTLVFHEILEIERTFREAITRFNTITVFDCECIVGRNRDFKW